jgi:glycosyltransferase 2 family protein
MHLRQLGGSAFRWILRVAVSVGIVVYILVDVDRHDLVRAFERVRIVPVLWGLALYLVGQLLSSYKWELIGRSVGFRRTYAEYTRFYFIGMFFNLFGLSTLGGDVVRGLYLGDGRRPGLALNSVLFDRASGLALLMALGAVAIVLFPQYDLPWPLAAGIAAGGLGLVLGWWTCPRLVRLLPAGNRMRRLIEVDMAPFWRDRAMLLEVAVVSVVFHLTQVTVQWVLARALGIELPFSYCLILHPVLSVMMALPVSVGGFGVREGGYLYFLTRINIDDSLAVTMGLLWFAVTVLAGLVGGAFFLASGAELPRLRTPRPSDAAA